MYSTKDLFSKEKNKNNALLYHQQEMSETTIKTLENFNISFISTEKKTILKKVICKISILVFLNLFQLTYGTSREKM